MSTTSTPQMENRPSSYQSDRPFAILAFTCFLLIFTHFAGAAPESFHLLYPTADATVCNTTSPTLRWSPSFVQEETLVREDLA